MRAQVLAGEPGRRTWVLVMDPGDDPVGEIRRFATENGVGAARITAVGGFSAATLGYFDRERLVYDPIPVSEQVEVLSLLGDIALDEGAPAVHLHVVVGRRDGTTRGGHLLDARVWPTLEVVLDEAPRHLHKRHDPETGLALTAPEG